MTVPFSGEWSLLCETEKFLIDKEVNKIEFEIFSFNEKVIALTERAGYDQKIIIFEKWFKSP